jgi:hypothetical protein
MSYPPRPAVLRHSPMPWLAIAAMVLLAACGGGASPSSDPSVAASAESSVAALPSSEPSDGAEPSEAAEAPCLPADLLAGMEAIESVEVGPDLPAAELADAIEALDLSQFEELTQTMQDDLVELLRDGEASSFDAQVAAGVILQTTGMTEC